MKKSLLIFLLCCISISSFCQDFSFSTGLSTGLMIEKGEVSSRTLLYNGAAFSVISPWYFGDMDFGIRYNTGSLLGSIQSIGLNFVNRFLVNQFYNPSIGISLELDFGDYMFFSDGVLDMPPIPLFYAGVSVEPLALRFSQWRVSLLKMNLLAGFTETLPWRFKMDLLSLALEPVGESENKKKHAYTAVGISSGLSSTLIGNFMTSGLNIPELTLIFYYEFLEASISFQGLNTFSMENLEKGFYLGAEFLLSPVDSFWSPAVGIGYYYFTILPTDKYYDPDSWGVCGVLKALRFNFILNKVLDFSISALELRFGPLFANELTMLYDQGNFLIKFGLLEIGLRYGFTERRNK